MSQENVEIMRKMLDAFDRRDRAAWLALRVPECEVIPSAMWPEVDAIRGREAAWDFYIEVAEPFERRPLAPDTEAVDAGPDKVLVHHHAVLRGRASSADVELNYWLILTFREGQILRDEWFTDRAQALEAVGLRE
jgi:ketosteroid isomerase-like protein